MSLITVLVALIVLGLLLYLVEAWIPMDNTIKRIIEIVVILFVVLWLLQGFGLLQSVNNIRVEPINK